MITPRTNIQATTLGLTLRALRELVAESGPCTSRQLADRMGLIHTTAAMRLDRYERAGFVEREAAPPTVKHAAYVWRPAQ
ncbi:MAG: helix-turn-helix domain-containing protein [Bacteroidota bacterium]